MRHSTPQYRACVDTWKSMKVSLWFGPAGRHTLRFDEIELAEISSLMQHQCKPPCANQRLAPEHPWDMAGMRTPGLSR